MKRLGIWPLTWLTFFWLGLTSWLRPLHMPDEARYVGIALEMMRSGDWLTPTLNGLPFFHKPPLFYWLTAASMSVFGVHEWSARLTPLLAATASATVLFVFTQRWSQRARAEHALWVLLVHPLFFIGAQFANLDILVATCIAITILMLAHVVLSLEQGQFDRRVLIGAYLMAGLGVLAKGLIGVALPGMVITVWLLLRGQWRTMWSLISVAGIAAFLLVVAPWFVLMQQRFPEFLNYFFVVHHFKRFAAEGFNNVQPWYFYPALLLLTTLAGLSWLAQTLRGAVGTADVCGKLRQLMWVWVLSITVFFSVPMSKPLGYILPVIFPLAFLIADGYAIAGGTLLRRRIALASLAFTAVLGLVVVGTFVRSPHSSHKALSKVLGLQMSAEDQVVMLNRFDYDVPFYSGTRHPVWVVEDWRDPNLMRNDSWPKELADAAKFATQANWLIEPSMLTPRLCAANVSWLIGSADSLTRYPQLAAAATVFSDGEDYLWKIDRKNRGPMGDGPCPPSPVSRQPTQPAPTN